jgi:AP-1 complex subunit gamma-1
MIIDAFGSHLNVDLQQRGVEFSQLFKDYNHLRDGLLEKMPPMQVSRVSQHQQHNGYSMYDTNPTISMDKNGLDEIIDTHEVEKGSAMTPSSVISKVFLASF